MVERRLRRKEGVERHGFATADTRTARICRLLEEAARDGERALGLLAQARTLYGHAGPGDDAARAALLRDLGRRLAEVEREGRRRIRQARLLLRPAARLRLVRP